MSKYGLVIYGESGIAQFDGVSPNFFLKGKKTINLQGWHSNIMAPTPSGGAVHIAGHEHTISMRDNIELYAVHSSVWVRTSIEARSIKIYQPLKASADQATIYAFNSEKITGINKYGLSFRDDGGKDVGVDGKFLLKILDYFSLDPGIRRWDYRAPKGKKIAVLIGGGNSSLYVSKDPTVSNSVWSGDTYNDSYFRILENELLEVAIMDSEWKRSAYKPGVGTQRMNTNVIIVDITDMYHMQDLD